MNLNLDRVQSPLLLVHDASRPQTVKHSAVLRANAHDSCPSRWVE
jgi:hypothetical protein